MILESTLRAAEHIINYYLQLDDESIKRLQKLVGKTLAIELDGPAVILYFSATPQQLTLSTQALSPPEATLKGTPLNLLKLLVDRHSQQQLLFEKKISLQGHIELAQQFNNLFNQIDIDWEAHLAKWVGDFTAHQIGSITRKVFAWTKQTKNTLQQNLNEYLHEEIRFFPPREEIDDFSHDVSILRNDVERLEARVAHLQAYVKND